jgi:hypothetical protein
MSSIYSKSRTNQAILNCLYPYNKRHLINRNTGIVINALSVQTFSWPRFKAVISRAEMKRAKHLHAKFHNCNCTEAGLPRELMMSLCHLWESRDSNSRWSSIKIFQNCSLILALRKERHTCSWSLPTRIKERCQAQFIVQQNGAFIEERLIMCLLL